MLKKIVIIGPESTGKSSLCEQLAQHYQTSWVPEYAREYLEEHGTNYTYENLLTIAKAQIASEEEHTVLATRPPLIIGSSLTAHPSLLFIDTDMYVMKVWCEFVFNRCDNWILRQIARRPYSLYLLCDVDLPWLKDNLREYPDLETRTKLYHYYKDIMINQATPWVNIRGNYTQRLKRAIKAIDFLTA